MVSNVISIKGAHRAPVAERSSMETLIVTPDIVNQWRLPGFQRPLRVNDKVRALAKEIANDEAIPGVITLGRIDKDPHLYVVDGQHRREAFLESGCREALVDVRVVNFASMPEMADAFVDLNTALVKMRPDDVLRGLEGSVPILRKVREACPFVGYDHIRRGTYSPILSMSLVFRVWFSSRNDTPTNGSSGLSARGIMETFDDESAERLIIFLRTAYEAWGKDQENNRLWGALNLTLCAWIFRRLVMNESTDPTKRSSRLTLVQFKKCLMSLSADGNYVDWLVGRSLSDRDRSPCYKRIAAVIRSRLQDDGEKSPKVLLPEWVSS